MKQIRVLSACINPFRIRHFRNDDGGYSHYASLSARRLSKVFSRA